MPSIDKNAEWYQVMQADIAATGSISKTAKRIGVSRPTLSQIINGVGPYGTGKASTGKIAVRIMNTIGMTTCPFLTEYHGTEQRISGLECREYADRQSPPTNSPREMQHWRACQGCANRITAPKSTTQESGQQQAGVIDKVTLPLPIIGGPRPVI